jgi:hypothetical protein
MTRLLSIFQDRMEIGSKEESGDFLSPFLARVYKTDKPINRSALSVG